MKLDVSSRSYGMSGTHLSSGLGKKGPRTRSSADKSSSNIQKHVTSDTDPSLVLIQNATVSIVAQFPVKALRF